MIEETDAGLDVSLAEQDYVVAQTDGVSPAFLRELVRKAALQAARSGSATVRDEHFRAALELLEQGGSITRAMLGAGGGATAELELGGGWTGTWSGSGGGGDVAFDDG